MVKLGVKGKITQGKYEGWHILIERQEGKFKGENTTSYDVFVADNEDPKKGYDTWFSNYDSVVRYIDKMRVQWLDESA